MDDDAIPMPPMPSPRPTGLPKRSRPSHPSQDDVPPTSPARTRPARLQSALEHARQCARIAEDNRAKDILLLDLTKATPLVDYFVIATATSRRQANAIAIEIDMAMKRIDEAKLGMEGTEEGRWVLIDYGDFVVHIFSAEARAYYALEDLWGDAPQVEWADPDRPRPMTTRARAADLDRDEGPGDPLVEGTP